MKCWNPTFNARGSRLIIVLVQLGAVKIYVAAVEALRQKERQDQTRFTHQNWWFSEFHPPLNGNESFLKSHPVYDQTQGSGAVFFLH